MLLYMKYIILYHSDLSLGIGDFFFYILFIYILCLYVLVCCSFWSQESILEAASLSLGIEARSVYIPLSPDPISSFAICEIYWVWLLLVVGIGFVSKEIFYKL
ncbi:hypothetical protein Hanom_Chr16g01429731 [Helianthus anomalus]